MASRLPRRRLWIITALSPSRSARLRPPRVVVVIYWLRFDLVLLDVFPDLFQAPPPRSRTEHRLGGVQVVPDSDQRLDVAPLERHARSLEIVEFPVLVGQLARQRQGFVGPIAIARRHPAVVVCFDR